MLSEQNAPAAITPAISQPNYVTYSHPKLPSRVEAGQLLARLLRYYAAHENAIVLSVKPAATLLAYEIAKILELPLDLLLIKLLKYNGLTFGAITDKWNGIMLKDQVVRGSNITTETIDQLVTQERAELSVTRQKYGSSNLPLPTGENATIILATDGIQTGQDIRAVISILKNMGFSGKIILVSGIIGSDAQKIFMHEADDVISLKSPQIVGSVASWYKDSEEIPAEQVRAILQHA